MQRCREKPDAHTQTDTETQCKNKTKLSPQADTCRIKTTHTTKRKTFFLGCPVTKPVFTRFGLKKTHEVPIYIQSYQTLFTLQTHLIVRCNLVSYARTKRKRSKALVLVLLPALIFIGVVGWLITSFEPSNRNTKKVHHKAPIVQKETDNGITFIPAIYQDSDEIINN